MQRWLLLFVVILAAAGPAEDRILRYGGVGIRVFEEPVSRVKGFSGTVLRKSNGELLAFTDRVSFEVAADIDASAWCAKHGLAEPKALTWAPGRFTARVIAGADAVLDAVERLSALPEVLEAAPVLVRHLVPRFIPNDYFFSRQWNLRNVGGITGGFAGNDANLSPAWDKYTGAGINIGIVDEGIELNHEDLAGNLVSALGIDVWDADNDPSPEPGVAHGTNVAGIACAVGNNSVGICGVAFESGLVAIRYLYTIEEDDLMAQALTHTLGAALPAEQVQIFNNSYGPQDDGVTLEAPGPLTLSALQAGTEHGRNGKGAIYVWAGGNGRGANDDANYDGFASSIYTIAVAASGGDGSFASYSEPGASIMLNAPSGYDGAGVPTTHASGIYKLDFGGTSAAAPVVSGVAALMLEANSALTWRDVAHVLIDSAQMNDPVEAGWFTNAAGRHFNRNYGFGRVDAAAAAALAETWQNVPALAPPVSAAGEVNLVVPDNDPAGVSNVLNIDAPAGFVTERVLVRVSAQHPFRGDLEWTLTSPQGTTILLARSRPDGGTEYLDWPLESLASWGEDPSGPWTLKADDAGAQDEGTWTAWSITVYGYIDEDTSLPAGTYSADRDASGALSMSELLRLVQFYNFGAFHCESGTEDGFAPGPGPGCAPYSADYAPQDWSISLSELLRSVQLFNSGGYTACPEGEDGFCPAL